jgi:hypothetical protein
MSNQSSEASRVTLSVPDAVVERQSRSGIDAANAAMMLVQAKRGFTPGELFARLGIEADRANDTAVDA